jgi:hypothetical protein
MNIIQAILDGERDPWELAALAAPGVKATSDEIVKRSSGPDGGAIPERNLALASAVCVKLVCAQVAEVGR